MVFRSELLHLEHGHPVTHSMVMQIKSSETFLVVTIRFKVGFDFDLAKSEDFSMYTTCIIQCHHSVSGVVS